MTHRKGRGIQAGFTVIETVLFLAVTGVLVAGLMGGVGIALNNQRYLDSVQSFKSLLQEQYGDLTVVSNDRSDDWSCDTSAETSQPSSGTTKPRGQSDCFIAGRYIVINQSTVSITDVIAREAGTTGSPAANDIDKLKSDYELNLSKVLTEEQNLEWDVQIASPVSGGNDYDKNAGSNSTPRSIVILLIRSPDSGTLYTFTKNPQTNNELDPANVTQADIKGMIVAGDRVPGQGDRLICLDSNQLSTSGNTGFYIEAYATNASAIQTRSNDTKVVGGDAQC